MVPVVGPSPRRGEVLAALVCQLVLSDCRTRLRDEEARPLVVDSGRPKNVVFVTSTTHFPGALGGLAGADAICEERARAAGLGGTYLAWLTTTKAAAVSRLQGSRGWVRTDGKPFADTAAALVAARPVIYYPPLLDESGKAWPGAPVVTGDFLVGVPGDTQATDATRCNDYSSMTGLVSAGSASSGAPSWNGGGVTWCGEQSPASAFQGPVHLYCFGVDHQEPVSFAPAMGRVAFHSQGFFDAALGLPGADAQCASEAEAHGLGGSYRALLSTSSAAASSRFDTSRARWVRTDGIPVVERAADLFSDVDGATVLAPPVGPDGLSNTSSPHAADTDSFYGIPSVIWAGSGRWTEPGGGMNDCQNWTSRGVDDFATLRLASETKLSGDGGDVFWNACLFRFTLWCLQE